MKVICICTDHFDELEFILYKEYTVIKELPFGKRTFYQMVNDYNILTSISSEYFISLEEFRNNQIDKII